MHLANGAAMDGWIRALLLSLTAVTLASTVVLARSSTIEINVDLIGSDYWDFPDRSGSPQFCQRICVGEPTCVAWTFVRKGVRGSRAARCWMKNQVPQEKKGDPCCVSGVIQ